ncbi:hypothetical protein QFC19_001784 [Naganishia cerealis]|uniref:Uncharacterized protein n=1 Tax=Naganishia cerealis TaxID=610337 RepID=A0ACC2WF76_9TREE|nr:hypothetical protein QFC19_001784 [Naganishia cerealis]
MAEVLLGTYKAYVNSVYAPHIQPLDSDTTLESWNVAENNYSEDGTIESSIEDSSSVTGDDLRNALPAAEDDATIFASKKRDQMRTPMAKRGWLFSSGYKPSERDLEIRRQYLPIPKRVISPWGTNWEGRELNEMVLFKAFDNPQVYRRNQWRELSRDRKWRMFERVVITDRHAAHNDKSSQTEIWNKMALGILHESLPSGLPHWFIAPQDSLTTSLSLPAVPLERRPSSSGTGYRSLADSFVKIVYVDRQNSDRRFDNVSHEGLMEVLEDLHEHGAKWNEREKADKAGKMKEKKVKVKVDVVKFEHLNAKEQIAAVYDADVGILRDVSK